MRSLGATIIDPIDFPIAEDWKYTFVGQSKRVYNGTIIVLEYDLKNDMEKFLMTELTNTSNIKTLEDMINYNELHSDLEFPPGTCCQGTFVAADQLGPRENSAEYWYAKSVQQQLNEEGTKYAFRVNKLDLLLLPTEGSAARLGAVGRCPVGTVPVGYDTINLPYGMSFVGQRYDEPTVFRAMSAYEAKFPVRKAPPTLD
ncbi:hypothetical protein BS50DRAFT_640654 [Corynespora cassiicola Philippines]|uniref:Amidase domain-containing protein n=1 Tax=Corynespora cassiicola Philippines TaxID=1448308 RepID=A0A2T2N2M7_CORCC|nr:hypothetical protein BS50DRAFT_640654 [Corynespora cassiicola Philippines]